MEIFKNRPLFLACMVYMAVLAAGIWLPFTQVSIGIVVVCLGSAAAVWAAVFYRRSLRRAVFGTALALLAIVAVFQAFWVFELSTAPFDGYADTPCKIEGIVDKRSGSTLDVRILSIDGKPRNVLAYVNCEGATDLQEGHRFSATAELSSLDAFAEPYYPASVMRSDGYRLACRLGAEAEVEILEEDVPSSMRFWSAVRRWSIERIRAGMRLFDDTRDTLTEAMLLGDKSALSDVARRDFNRSGVAHLLALSGLHVVLLFGVLERILAGALVPRKLRAAVVMLAAVGYVFLTGCSLSVTRAVCMLSMVSLARLLSVSSDSRTSLGVAGALILFFQPQAVTDAGFWMSFSSTFGLLTMMPVAGRVMRRWNYGASRLSLGWQWVVRCAAWLVGLLMVGVVAMTFSLWITALSVGMVNPSSVWLTVLMTPAAWVLLLGGALLIPFGGTPVGDGIGWVVYAAERWMLELARQVSVSTEPMSLRGLAVLPCVLMAVVLFVMLCGRIRRLWHWFVPVVLGWGVLFLVAGMMRLPPIRAMADVQVTYGRSSVQSEVLVVSMAGQSVLIDLSGGAHSSWSTATKQALADGSVEWEAVILTDYHTRTPGALAQLMERKMVRALWLPTPQNEDDYDRMLSCVEKAEAMGVPVTVYGESSILHLFDKAELALRTTYIERSTKAVHLVSLSTSDEELTLCSAAVFESDLGDEAAARIADSEAVVIAAVGPTIRQDFSVAFLPSASVAFGDHSIASHCLSTTPEPTIGTGRFFLQGE